MDDRARVLNQADVIAHQGLDPDAPGTELANYFDQYSLDELAGVIDYLRSPYRESNAYYIRHAQNAIRRKRGSEQWEDARLGAAAVDVPIPRRPYTELGLIENDDLRMIAFEAVEAWERKGKLFSDRLRRRSRYGFGINVQVRSPSRARVWCPYYREHSLLCRRNHGSDSPHLK